MPFCVNQFLRTNLVIYLLCTTVLGLGHFTNPSSSDNSTTLTIGETFTIEWNDSGLANADYSELSLGVWCNATNNIFWLLSNVIDYTPQNYQFTVALGNGITLDDGPFAFILVNGTDFGEEVFSSEFEIKAAASTTSSNSISTYAPTSSPTISPTASASATITPSSSPTVAPSSSSGLSTGAGAGIGVGLALGVIALLAFAFLAWRRRRGHRALAPTGNTHEASENRFGNGNGMPYDIKPECGDAGYTSYSDAQKNVSSGGYAEAPGSEVPQIQEAPAEELVHEAP